MGLAEPHIMGGRARRQPKADQEELSSLTISLFAEARKNRRKPSQDWRAILKKVKYQNCRSRHEECAQPRIG